MLANLLRLVALLAVCYAGAVSAESVAVPGTKVSIDPPDGFTLADKFPGFMREDASASIMVTEMPAPVVEIQKAMNKDDLASRGMELISKETIKHDGKDALLVNVKQQAAGMQFLKWMLVTGAQQHTTLVVGTFPEETAAKLSEPIKAAVLSTATKAASGAQAQDQFEGLLFRVQPSAKLKIATRVGNMLLLNETGTTEPAKAEGAMYVVGNAVSDAAIDDLGAFAKARAGQTAQVRDLRNIAERRVKLDGLEASEIVADAVDAKSGTPLRFYQVVAPDKGGYFIAQGLVGAQRGEEFLGHFREISGSFTRARK